MRVILIIIKIKCYAVVKFETNQWYEKSFLVRLWENGEKAKSLMRVHVGGYAVMMNMQWNADRNIKSAPERL